MRQTGANVGQQNFIDKIVTQNFAVNCEAIKLIEKPLQLNNQKIPRHVNIYMHIYLLVSGTHSIFHSLGENRYQNI